MSRNKRKIIAVKPLNPPATEAEKNEASRVWTAAMDVMQARGFGRHLWGNTSGAAQDFVILMLRAHKGEHLTTVFEKPESQVVSAREMNGEIRCPDCRGSMRRCGVSDYKCRKCGEGFTVTEL